MQVKTPIKIRYAETDKMGVVYHANYLLYFEDARTDFLEKIHYPYAAIEQVGYLYVVYHVDLQYRMPLRYGDDAFVLTRVVNNSLTKTDYLQEVYRADMDPEHDKALVTGLITGTVVRSSDFKPVSIKRALPELYAIYETLLQQ